MNPTEKLGIVVLFVLSLALGFVWWPHVRRQPLPGIDALTFAEMEAAAWAARLEAQQAALSDLGNQGAMLVWEWPDGLHVDSRN